MINQSINQLFSVLIWHKVTAPVQAMSTAFPVALNHPLQPPPPPHCVHAWYRICFILKVLICYNNASDLHQDSSLHLLHLRFIFFLSAYEPRQVTKRWWESHVHHFLLSQQTLVPAPTHLAATEVDLFQPADVKVVQVVTHELLRQLLHASEFVMTFLVQAVHTFMQHLVRPAHQGMLLINTHQTKVCDQSNTHQTKACYPSIHIRPRHAMLPINAHQPQMTLG